MAFSAEPNGDEDVAYMSDDGAGYSDDGHFDDSDGGQSYGDYDD